MAECLLAIDVQNDFCDPACRPRAVAGCEAAADNITRLAQEARRRGVPVVWVRTIHSEESDTPVWLSRHAGSDATCRPGTRGAEFYRVAPAPGEPIVTKHRYDAFLRTNLEELLRSMGVEHVLCCGFVTNVCVESTAREAFQRDFYVSLVEDACRAATPELHQAAIVNIRNNFGRVETVDGILGRWAGARAAS